MQIVINNQKLRHLKLAEINTLSGLYFNKKVSKLTEDVSKGKGGVAVLMALAAGVIGLLGFFNLKWNTTTKVLLLT